jgi:hypothetical protein
VEASVVKSNANCQSRLSSEDKMSKDLVRSSELSAEQKYNQETEPVEDRAPAQSLPVPQTVRPTPLDMNCYDPYRGRKRFAELMRTEFDDDFIRGIVKNIEMVAEFDDDRNLLFTAVMDIKPKTAGRIMLAVQRGATHLALMRQHKLLMTANDLGSIEVYERTTNKLSRTYMMQSEALEGRVDGRDATVNVHNVSVNDGGQAIVGNVRQGRPERSNEPTASRQAPAALADSKLEGMTPINSEMREPAPLQRRRPK